MVAVRCPAPRLCKTNGMRSCLWVPLLWALAWKDQTNSIYVLKSLEVRNVSESFLSGKMGRKSIGKIINLEILSVLLNKNVHYHGRYEMLDLMTLQWCLETVVQTLEVAVYTE